MTVFDKFKESLTKEDVLNMTIQPAVVNHSKMIYVSLLSNKMYEYNDVGYRQAYKDTLDTLNVEMKEEDKNE